MVKVATERRLNAKNSKDLGLFRQAYQHLRQSIRDNDCQSFKRESAEYKLYDELSCEFLKILSSSETIDKQESNEIVNQQIHSIKAISARHWELEVNNRKETEKQLKANDSHKQIAS